MKSATVYSWSRLSAAFTTASRSVKIPTSRSSSHTRTQSVRASCIWRMAFATPSPGETTTISANPRSWRWSPSTDWLYSSAGCGMSAVRRSAPQLPQVSSPSKLSWWQTGQSTARLLDRPGLAGEQRLRKVALAELLDRLLDLGVDEIRVGRPLDVAEDADWHRELGPPQPRQDQREGRILGVRVVDQQVVLAHA